jgi:hypothetical protein
VPEFYRQIDRPAELEDIVEIESATDILEFDDYKYVLDLSKYAEL